MSIATRTMYLLVTVSDCGSFSEVARREGIAPSSVSRQIQQLEQQLGQQLLYRNTRKLVPTEAGLLYIRTFRRILAELEETEHQLLAREQQPAGVVRINAPVVFGQKHLAPWLAELAERYPALQIELTQTDEFVDPFAGAADLVFRIGPLQDADLHVRVVDHSQHHLAASPEYIKRHGMPQHPEQLLQHNCLVYKGSYGAQRSYFQANDGASQVLSLSGTLYANNAETLVSAALNGAGIVMMPDWQIGEYLLNEQLISVLPHYQVAPAQQQSVIAILYPRTRFLPLNIRTVIDFFCTKFGEPPYWKVPS